MHLLRWMHSEARGLPPPPCAPPGRARAARRRPWPQKSKPSASSAASIVSSRVIPPSRMSGEVEQRLAEADRACGKEEGLLERVGAQEAAADRLDPAAPAAGSVAPNSRRSNVAPEGGTSGLASELPRSAPAPSSAPSTPRTTRASTAVLDLQTLGHAVDHVEFGRHRHRGSRSFADRQQHLAGEAGPVLDTAATKAVIAPVELQDSRRHSRGSCGRHAPQCCRSPPSPPAAPRPGTPR